MKANGIKLYFFSLWPEKANKGNEIRIEIKKLRNRLIQA